MGAEQFALAGSALVEDIVGQVTPYRGATSSPERRFVKIGRLSKTHKSRGEGLDINRLTLIDNLPPSQDDLSLTTFAGVATTFLLSQPWCNRINAGYLGHGWDGVLGIFFFEIETNDPEMDNRLWVLVGDIPPALFAANRWPKPSDALEQYVIEMTHWVDAVKSGQSVDDLIPVCYQDTTRLIEPTMQFAEILEKRLQFIKDELVPDTKAAESE